MARNLLFAWRYSGIEWALRYVPMYGVGRLMFTLLCTTPIGSIFVPRHQNKWFSLSDDLRPFICLSKTIASVRLRSMIACVAAPSPRRRSFPYSDRQWCTSAGNWTPAEQYSCWPRVRHHQATDVAIPTLDVPKRALAPRCSQPSYMACPLLPPPIGPTDGCSKDDPHGSHFPKIETDHDTNASNEPLQ